MRIAKTNVCQPPLGVSGDMRVVRSPQKCSVIDCEYSAANSLSCVCVAASAEGWAIGVKVVVDKFWTKRQTWIEPVVTYRATAQAILRTVQRAPPAASMLIKRQSAYNCYERLEGLSTLGTVQISREPSNVRTTSSFCAVSASKRPCFSSTANRLTSVLQC
ncbi:hypothetical protein BC835DRAFT_412142 [Cytidiella melzeri]|nr:hypothetical protein BC835DRAFT_412142 [Cytidiella melzeri]